MKRNRNQYDPRWAMYNRVEWQVFLRAGDITLTIYVMAPDDATDIELFTSAASKLKRQRDRYGDGG